MKQNKIIALAALACLAAGAVALRELPPLRDGPDLQDMLAVPKTETQMHLYSANRKAANGKSFGFDHYVNGGRTIYHIHNDLETGASEDIYLRADGSKQSSRDYYPLQAGEELPLLFSRAEFAADGVTYTSHDVYSEKGLLERSGRLLPSGWYQQSYFCADGVKMRRLRLFDSKKSFLSEKVYDCLSGALLAEIAPGQYSGQFLIALRRADGSRKALINKSASGSSGDVFAADGQTVTASFTSQYYGAGDVRYFAGKDKLSQIWSSSFGRTKIDVYDPESGKRILAQEWKERPGENGGEKRLLLMKVTEFTGDAWTREIEMTPDGRLPATVSYPLGMRDLHTLKLPVMPGGYADLEKMRSRMRIVQSLDASGKVVKSEIAVENQSGDNVLQAQPLEPLAIRIAPALLQLPSHEDLPDFNDMGPERVYDYEAGTTPSAPAPSYSGYEWFP